MKNAQQFGSPDATPVAGRTEVTQCPTTVAALVDGEFDLTDWLEGMAILRGPEGRAEAERTAERSGDHNQGDDK